MTLLDRYRDHREDPYRGYYASSPRWGRRAAIGLPVGIAVVLIVNFALVAASPGAHARGGLAHVSGMSYESLLLPSKATTPTFQIGKAQSGHPQRGSVAPQRVVMAPNPAPGTQVAGSRSGDGSASATSRHHVASSYSHGRYRTDANGYRIAPARDAAMVPPTTWVAHLTHSTKGYASANALQSNRKVPGAWYGYPSILPVIDATSTRLKVRLAQRPDEATSWISRKAAVMGRIHYAIVVDISQHWLYVFYKGVQQMSFPVGTGASGTPTPTGDYFVAFHAPPNGPGYGSVMLETSAHSRVISHFEGGDDAIIAIHGPVGSDAQIGDHGAAISNGCIRMHDRDLNKVRHVHNGSPVILTY